MDNGLDWMDHTERYPRLVDAIQRVFKSNPGRDKINVYLNSLRLSMRKNNKPMDHFDHPGSIARIVKMSYARRHNNR